MAVKDGEGALIRQLNTRRSLGIWSREAHAIIACVKYRPLLDESVYITASSRTTNQLFGTRSILSMDDEVRAEWQAGNISSLNGSVADAEVSQSSTSRIPDFGADNGSRSPFAIPSQPSRRFSNKSPTILASPFSAFSGQSPPIPMSVHAGAASSGSPSPSIFAPLRQAPPVPTATKPRHESSLKRQRDVVTDEEQPERKISRFVEDLPETRPAPKRALRTGGFRRSTRNQPDRRVRFDVDAMEE